ncbi:MAG: hypothetical protein Q4F35_08695, partial [Akkermansia sp.]|nr:hypothetical protein [Akkermansia sp.]
DKQQDKQQEQKKQQAQPAEKSDKAPNEKDKARSRAAGILQMHLDEETGSPIPHRNPVRPPAKDY